MTRPHPRVALARASIDALLRLDEGLIDDLAPLYGKVFALRVEGVGIEIALRPGPHGVDVLDPSEDEPARDREPDVTISGPPFSLLALLARSGEADAMLTGDVRITGDVALVQTLRRIAARADLDWEEPIARLIGDAPAHAAARVLRALAGWGHEAGETLLADAGEYLRHESDAIVDARAVRSFADAVDDLRDDAERLEARVARIRMQSTPT